MNWRVFWRLVDMPGEGEACWSWRGPRVTDGYGRFWTGAEYVLAHRLARLGEYAIGNAKPFVLHSCDNPICCNPAHLMVGSQTDNLNDMWSKDRGQYGRKHYEAKLNEEQVREIRQRYAAGGISQRELGEEYGMSQQGIFGVLRVNWRRVK